MVDTSKSITATNFENSVKPFLKDFVSDMTLNAGGAEGAQVSDINAMGETTAIHSKRLADTFKYPLTFGV